MKILFCDEGYEESRIRLAPLLPDWEIATCAGTEVADDVGGADVVVPYFASLKADVIARGRFGLIQQFGVGLETVDIEAATQAGVWVCRIPSGVSGNADSVADHALMLMLMLSRRFSLWAAAIAQRRLGEPAGAALAGKTACIIGSGDVGRALCARLAACRMRLVAVRLRRHAGEDASPALAEVYPAHRLFQALGDADYAICCANYGASSHHLFDAAAFAAMKPGAYFINVARGGLADSAALEAALQSGRLAGAGLDVIEEEPIDRSRALLSGNVIVSPHIAGVTDGSYSGIAAAFAANVRRYAGGLQPLYAVNRPVAPRGIV